MCILSIYANLLSSSIQVKKGGSSTIRFLYKKYRNIDVGYGSYGWTTDLFDGPLLSGNIQVLEKMLPEFVLIIY